MTFDLRRFISTQGNGTFLKDVDLALAAADAAGDVKGGRAVQQLWLEYFEQTLASKTQNKMETYLKNRLWKREGKWLLYKTTGPPYMAFTAFYLSNGSLVVMGLAFTYDLPKGGEAAWLGNVIRPRLAEL